MAKAKKKKGILDVIKPFTKVGKSILKKATNKKKKSK